MWELEEKEEKSGEKRRWWKADKSDEGVNSLVFDLLVMSDMT